MGRQNAEAPLGKPAFLRQCVSESGLPFYHLLPGREYKGDKENI